MDEESSSTPSSTSESDSELGETSSTTDGQYYGAGEKPRQIQSSKTYFEGRSRMPYRLRKRLSMSMDGNETVLEGVCKQRNPAFGKIVDSFRQLVHQGSELKKRKKGIQLPSMRAGFMTEI